MAAHLCSRQATARAHSAPRGGLRSRVLLVSAALVSALALMPHAHAQNNAAQGNGQNAAKNGNNDGNNDGNGAPAPRTAAQRTQEDAQRLLGGPSMALGGYNMQGATPDAQRDSLLNTERMRAAKPNTQTAGGPAAAAAGGDGPAAAPGGAIRRPARGGAAAGGAAQRGGPVKAADGGGAATAVYGDPYSQRAGRDVFKSPW
ncbi:hypothetical protein PPMP20_11665 [Paraburkholderia phymatum]|uniref:Uncharacterized protein n=1 Tax=Paraburkholderia phymatum (strain DSM 17167 / CIP 108236 / LMG 21445 / STM815) TaxID=391038 RepID=B2JGB2_PARP8|nr:hypothetical protein [Paraburkholderia phymatum]ACC71640.1 hypothetical protein Bphy_2467 [Paraburkholderia phymatum STM815]